MLTIILIVTFGVLFSVFATQNTQTVDVFFGSYSTTSIPLYIAILASVMIGILIVGFYHFLHWLSFSLTMGGKDKEITDYKKEVTNLTKEVHKLELENTKLKSKLDEEDDFDEDKF